MDVKVSGTPAGTPPPSCLHQPSQSTQMRHDARLLRERNSIQTARLIISPTHAHTHAHARTGEVGAAFLSFVLGGKGNL